MFMKKSWHDLAYISCLMNDSCNGGVVFALVSFLGRHGNNS